MLHADLLALCAHCLQHASSHHLPLPPTCAPQGDLGLVPELYSYSRRADLAAARELAQQLLCSAQQGGSSVPEWRVLLLQRYAHAKLAALSFLHRALPAVVAAPALLSIDYSNER